MSAVNGIEGYSLSLEDLPGEVWKDVVGYEGYYQVSNLGRVKSLERITRFRGRLVGREWGARILRPAANKQNRVGVSLWINNKGKSIHIHRLVLIAFKGPCPDGMECCHEDGNPKNNRLDNLRWGTKSSNQLDRARHGTSNAGSRHGASKLTEEDVLKIRELCITEGKKHRDVAAIFRVTRSAVTAIVSGKRWKHVIYQP